MTMIRPSLLPRAAVIGAALALSGCFGGGSPAPTELLTLTATATRAPGEPRTSQQGEAITVVTPSVSQASSTTRIPVYVSDTSIQYLTGARYIEQPAELFRQLVSETVAARTGRTVLDPALYSQVQGAVVSGQLIRFGLDPNSMQVVVLFEATITRNSNSATSQRFEAHVPVSEATPAAVAPALNQASNAVAQQVADWIGR